MSATAITHIVYGALALGSVLGCCWLDWHLGRRGMSWPTDDQ